jgi:hypothetical protein
MEVAAASFSDLCPLSPTVLHYDAVEAEDGRIYDSDAVAEWIRVLGANIMSPVTGEPMGGTLICDEVASARAAVANGRGLQSVPSTIFEELDKIQRLCLLDKLSLRAPSLMTIGDENSGESTVCSSASSTSQCRRARRACARG